MSPVIDDDVCGPEDEGKPQVSQSLPNVSIGFLNVQCSQFHPS